MGALALGLGILTVAGIVRLWHVYAFALLLGCVTAFDSPARHTFVYDRWLFGLALLIIGVSAQTFTISTNTLVQLSTEPVMRGRVMAILLAAALAPPSARRSSVGSLIGSARVGRSVLAPPRAWARQWWRSATSLSTVSCASALVLNASASSKTAGPKIPPTLLARAADAIERPN